MKVQIHTVILSFDKSQGFKLDEYYQTLFKNWIKEIYLES